MPALRISGNRVAKGASQTHVVINRGNARAEVFHMEYEYEAFVGPIAAAYRRLFAARRGETPTGRSGLQAYWVSNPPSTREDTRSRPIIRPNLGRDTPTPLGCDRSPLCHFV